MRIYQNQCSSHADSANLSISNMDFDHNRPQHQFLFRSLGFDTCSCSTSGNNKKCATKQWLYWPRNDASLCLLYNSAMRVN